jgi:hypothetical protein
VKRRGSDKKFVASVLAVGTECDIGEGGLVWVVWGSVGLKLPRKQCRVAGARLGREGAHQQLSLTQATGYQCLNVHVGWEQCGTSVCLQAVT